MGLQLDGSVGDLFVDWDNFGTFKFVRKNTKSNRFSKDNSQWPRNVRFQEFQ